MFCGCSSDPKTQALRSFEAHVKSIIDGFPNLKIQSFTFDPSSVKYDVEETKSLVSPFVGNLTFHMKQELPKNRFFIHFKNEVVYAMQDGKWKLQSHHSTATKLTGENQTLIDEMSENGGFLGKRRDVSEIDSPLNKLLGAE